MVCVVGLYRRSLPSYVDDKSGNNFVVLHTFVRECQWDNAQLSYYTEGYVFQIVSVEKCRSVYVADGELGTIATNQRAVKANAQDFAMLLNRQQFARFEVDTSACALKVDSARRELRVVYDCLAAGREEDWDRWMHESQISTDSMLESGLPYRLALYTLTETFRCSSDSVSDFSYSDLCAMHTFEVAYRCEGERQDTLEIEKECYVLDTTNITTEECRHLIGFTSYMKDIEVWPSAERLEQLKALLVPARDASLDSLLNDSSVSFRKEVGYTFRILPSFRQQFFE